MGFSQKWGSSEHFCWNFLNSVSPARGDKFYEIGHFETPPLSFSANRKKLNFGKIQNDKSVFSDISWPLTSFIFFFCAAFWNRLIALMKLFSLGRTVLAIPSKFGLPVAWYKYRKWWWECCACKWWYGTLTAPGWVVFAHGVQSSNDNRCRDSFISFFNDIIFKIFSIVISPSYWTLHQQ